MKITIHKNDLSKTAELVARVAHRKAEAAVLEGIVIKAEDNELTLTAYNLKTGITAKVDGTILEEGSACLDAKMFTDIVKKLPYGNIAIEVEKTTATIKGGESEFKLMGMDVDEFPDLPTVEETGAINLDRETLIDMIRQVAFSAAATDTNKVVHTGVKFHAYGGWLRLVSTDGYRMSYREMPFLGELEFVVPADALNEVSRLCLQTEEDVEIFQEPRHILFKIGDYTLISRLLEGDFLNYQPIMHQQSHSHAKINTIALQEALERVSIIVTDRLASPIKAVFGDNSIHLETSTATGRAEETIGAEATGDEVTIGFNTRFLAEALKATETDEVVIKLKDGLSPIMIEPTKGDYFNYLVLPVRLKG